MKIPTWLLSICVAGMFSLEAWTLNELVSLERQVAGLSARLDNFTRLTQK